MGCIGYWAKEQLWVSPKSLTSMIPIMVFNHRMVNADFRYIPHVEDIHRVT